MATDKKTSLIVENILPDFLLEDSPKYVAFIKAYYKFMEQNGKYTERSKNLSNYADIDSTLSSFLTHFERELAAFLPETTSINRAFLMKNAKDIYQRKGSEESYKILFRLLFNQVVTFDYPGERILRVSDGRWTQRQTIKISPPYTGNPAALFGKITGLTSGATARVLTSVETRELGAQVFELNISEVEGTLQDEEFIEAEGSGIRGKITSLTGGIRAVTVLEGKGGAGHRAGDKVRFTAALGSGANGTVLTTKSESVTFSITNGGKGYTTNATVRIIGGTGTGANYRVTEISNTETVLIYEDVIADLEDTPLNYGDGTGGIYLGGNSDPVTTQLGNANVSSRLVDALGTTSFTVGTISSIEILSRGVGYIGVPTTTVTQDVNPDIASQEIPDGSGGIYGTNAVIAVDRFPGAIGLVSVDNPGSGYFRLNNVTISNITRGLSGTDNATGVPSITAISSESGKYTDTRGFLSWDNKIQDNYFYQEFSYVLQSEKQLDDYERTILDSIHPAGTKLFGEVEITSNVDGIVSAETFKLDIIKVESEKIINAQSTIVSGLGSVLSVPTLLAFNSNKRFNELRIDMITIDRVNQHTVHIPKTINQLLVSNNIPTGYTGTSGSQTEGFPYVTTT